jgi:hypothetical protein
MESNLTRINLGKRTMIGIALALGTIAVPASGMVINDGSGTATTAALKSVTPADRLQPESPTSWTGRTTYQPVPLQTSTPVAARPDRASREGSGTRTIAVAVGDDHARTAPQAISVVPASSVAAGSDFDWTDAGIGFGSAAGLALLAGGSFLATRRVRGSNRPAL